MSNDIQSAVERARMVAAKITSQFSDSGSAKRPADSSIGLDDSSSKKFASNVNDAVGAQLALLKAQQLGGNISEEFKVPDKLVGLVIGRGGEQLHRLQADTQCKVQIAPDAHGSPDRIFTLIGTKDAIERAKRSIDEILKRGSSLGSDPTTTGPQVLLQRNNCEIVEVKIPGNKCGLVIGKGGETIKRLSEQYGVKLVVVQETSTASSGDKPLRITGEPEKVAAAKGAILEMLNPTDSYHGGGGGGGRKDYGDKRQNYGGGPNSSEAFIKVPGDKAGIVIGKGGESIKEINRRSGAHVEIDKSQRGASDGNDKMFIIKGTQEEIQYAQQLIYEKITGIQGSQPPHGYFNDPNQMSPMQGGYGGGAGGQGRGGASSYGAQQQQQYMNYQQAGQPGAQATDPNMSAAWAAYYQQYYGAAGQPGATPAAGQPAATTAATTATAQPTVNPSTGQPDYSQAWVEYYRSLGMYEQADAILKQNASAGAAGASQTNGASSTPAATASQQHSASSAKQNGSSNGYSGAQQQQAGGSWPGYSASAGYGQGGYASGYSRQEGSTGH